MKKMDNKIKNKIRMTKEFVIQNVPFYRDKVSLVNFDSPDFSEFPVIQKQDLRDSPELFLSNKENLISEYTSGSTGFPLTLYKTKTEMMRLEAFLIRERKKAVKDFEKLKLIKFYAELHTGENRCYEKIYRENNILYLSMLHMDVQSFEEYIQAIENEVTDGGWIMGPPSVISRFAQYVCDTDRVLAKIKFVEFTGELLNEYQRNVTKKAFDCVIRNHYGSREFWCIAYECECGNMHILENNVYVENSENGLLVSLLGKHTMPLIRYRVGDNCHVSDRKCSCGNNAPILETFSGRTTDFIVTPYGNEVSSILIYMIIVNLNLLYSDIIQQFKVIQKSVDSFDLYAVLSDRQSQTDELEQYFLSQFESILGYTATVTFHYVKDIPVDFKTGKLKYFVSLLKKEG